MWMKENNPRCALDGEQEISGLLSRPVGETRTLRAEVVALPTVRDRVDFGTAVSAADPASLVGVTQTVEVGHWETQRAVKVVARLQDAHGNAKIAPRTVRVEVAATDKGGKKVSVETTCDVRGSDGTTRDCKADIPRAWFAAGGVAHAPQSATARRSTTR